MVEKQAQEISINEVYKDLADARLVKNELVYELTKEKLDTDIQTRELTPLKKTIEQTLPLDGPGDGKIFASVEEFSATMIDNPAMIGKIIMLEIINDVKTPSTFATDVATPLIDSKDPYFGGYYRISMKKTPDLVKIVAKSIKSQGGPQISVGSRIYFYEGFQTNRIADIGEHHGDANFTNEYQTYKAGLINKKSIVLGDYPLAGLPGSKVTADAMGNLTWTYTVGSSYGAGSQRLDGFADIYAKAKAGDKNIPIKTVQFNSTTQGTLTMSLDADKKYTFALQTSPIYTPASIDDVTDISPVMPQRPATDVYDSPILDISTNREALPSDFPLQIGEVQGGTSFVLGKDKHDTNTSPAVYYLKNNANEIVAKLPSVLFPREKNRKNEEKYAIKNYAFDRGTLAINKKTNKLDIIVTDQTKLHDAYISLQKEATAEADKKRRESDAGKISRAEYIRQKAAYDGAVGKRKASIEYDYQKATKPGGGAGISTNKEQQQGDLKILPHRGEVASSIKEERSNGKIVIKNGEKVLYTLTLSQLTQGFAVQKKDIAGLRFDAVLRLIKEGNDIRIHYDVSAGADVNKPKASDEIPGVATEKNPLMIVEQGLHNNGKPMTPSQQVQKNKQDTERNVSPEVIAIQEQDKRNADEVKARKEGNVMANVDIGGEDEYIDKETVQEVDKRNQENQEYPEVLEGNGLLGLPGDGELKNLTSIDGGEYGAARKNKDGSHREHKGLDFAIGYGDSVKSVYDGKVLKIYTEGKVGQYNKNGSNGGNSVTIDHGNGYFTYYGHLSEVYVKKDAEVAIGDIIGKAGNTGITYSNKKKVTDPNSKAGTHLHFELGIGGISEKNKVDPMPYFKGDKKFKTGGGGVKPEAGGTVTREVVTIPTIPSAESARVNVISPLINKLSTKYIGGLPRISMISAAIDKVVSYNENAMNPGHISSLGNGGRGMTTDVPRDIQELPSEYPLLSTEEKSLSVEEMMTRAKNPTQIEFQYKIYRGYLNRLMKQKDRTMVIKHSIPDGQKTKDDVIAMINLYLGKKKNYFVYTPQQVDAFATKYIANKNTQDVVHVLCAYNGNNDVLDPGENNPSNYQVRHCYGLGNAFAAEIGMKGVF